MNAFNPNTGTITFADERKKAVALGKELIVGDVYSITFKETTIPALKCYVGIPYWGQTARPSVPPATQVRERVKDHFEDAANQRDTIMFHAFLREVIDYFGGDLSAAQQAFEVKSVYQTPWEHHIV